MFKNVLSAANNEFVEDVKRMFRKLLIAIIKWPVFVVYAIVVITAGFVFVNEPIIFLTISVVGLFVALILDYFHGLVYRAARKEMVRYLCEEKGHTYSYLENSDIIEIISKYRTEHQKK